MNSVANTIIRRIRAKRRGWVFTPKDFLDVAPRATVDQTLSRLVNKNIIRKLDRGVYDFPKQHAMLGVLNPGLTNLVQAVAAKTGDDLFVSGAAAANALGLSTQVSSKPVYLTNGPSKVKNIAGRKITLKHAKVPILDKISKKANLTLQALFYLGKSGVDDKVISLCAHQLDDSDIRDIKTVAAKIPGWMADIILRIQQNKYEQIRN